eukprot:m.126417 g.126417  ORF g.126417 m.126417 type:complete len:981 (-) comp11189_c0_seq4:875-3817(-)
MAGRPMFDGSYKKKKMVSLGGRSRETRDANAARIAREERARKRRELVAAATIQRVWRGHAARMQWADDLRQRWDALEAGDTQRLDLLPHFFAPVRDSARGLAAASLACNTLFKGGMLDESQAVTVTRLAAVVVRIPPSEDTIGFCAHSIAVTWPSEQTQQHFIQRMCQAGFFRHIRSVLDSAREDLAASAATAMQQLLGLAKDPIVFGHLAHDILTAEASPAIVKSLSTPAVFTTVLEALSAHDAALQPLLVDADPSKATWLLTNLVEISLSPCRDGGGGRSVLTRLHAVGLGHLVHLMGELLPRIPQEVFVDPTDDDMDDLDDSLWDADEDSADAMDTAAAVSIAPQWQGLRRIIGIDFTREVIKLLRSSERPTDVQAVCRLVNLTLDRCTNELQRATLLSVVAFEPGLVKHLWGMIAARGELLDKLAAGSLADYGETVAYVRLFGGAYGHLLLTQDDTEFLGKSDDSMGSPPPSTDVLELRLVVEIVAILRDLAVALFMSDALYCFERPVLELRKSLCALLKQLFGRDERISFCPPGHWLSMAATTAAKTAPLHTINVVEFQTGDVSAAFPKAAKLIDILKTLPFVLPFDLRAKLFQSLIEHDRQERDPQGGMNMFQAGQFVDIRRDHLYEDAFDKLNKLGPSLRGQTRVRMHNEQGLEEAGVDGGGVFREFLSNVIQEGYGLQAGLFRSTPEQQIYPHPQAHLLNPDALSHFEFLGRLLGKALYVGMLVELPFAPFFLSKLLGQQSFLNDLASLDPDLHRNLLFLKNYEGDCTDLSLDFTIQEDDPSLGSSSVIELIPNGRNIPVTNDNRIRYVYHVANFRLNIQIRAQSAAFCRGLFDVINREWFLMFSPTEIQTLISGSEASIDIGDLRRNTVYSGGLTEGHVTVELFWSVVYEMDDEERHALVKFVTSCRRPPLFGFGQLHPKFCIHGAGEVEDRLPTASTCMNLLKLPIFKSRETLKEKLIYAIKSGAGFELS